MAVQQERIRVTFTDMTRIDILFELREDGTVMATATNEAGDMESCREVGSIPDEGEPWERDFHEWCATYVHTRIEGVLMTESHENLFP